MGPVQKLTVLITLFWLSALSVGWVVILAVPVGWARKATILYTIEMGLYEVQISEGTAARMARMLSSSAGQQVQGKLKDLQYGTFGLEEHQALWCRMHLELLGMPACWSVGVVAYSSWTMLALGVIGVMCLVIGGMVLYWYAFTEAHRWMRNVMKGVFSLATFCFLLGSSQYAFFIEELKMLPPAADGTAANYLTFTALIMTALTLLPVAAAFFLEPSEDEIRNETEAERRQIERDQRLMGFYGSTDASKLEQGGQMQPQMQQPPQGPPMPGVGGQMQPQMQQPPQGPPLPGMGQPGPTGYPAPATGPFAPAMGQALG